MLNVAAEMFRYPFQKDHSYDRHKDIIKKLKFIARIEGGDRINVNTISTTTNTFLSSVYRTFFKESRAKTFQFLTDTIDRSFELLILYQESNKISDKITCSHIFEDLHHAINGLRNLQVTYNDDQNFYCDIDTLIGSVYARLAEWYQNDHIFISDEQKARLHGIIFPNMDIPKKIKQDVKEVEKVMEEKVKEEKVKEEKVKEEKVKEVEKVKEEIVEKVKEEKVKEEIVEKAKEEKVKQNELEESKFMERGNSFHEKENLGNREERRRNKKE